MARGEIRVHWPLLLSCGLCLLGLNVDDAAGVATGPGSTPVHFQQLNLRKDDANQSKCENIRRFPASQQCSFVRNTTACHMDGGFLNYLHLPYCVLAGYEAAGLVIIFLWMMYIFFSLSLVVDLVLCPSLKVITTALNMDENVAGVTFLAFGNGAADIFSLVLLVLRGDGDADDDDDVTGVAGMGSILGGGVFVTCISAGLIVLNYPLEDIEKWPFVRNIIFYMISVAWLIGMLADSTIYLGEAVGFICLYLVYVFVVWLGHRVSQRAKTGGAPANDVESETERSPLLGSKPLGNSQPSYGSHGVDDVDGGDQTVGRGLQSRTRDASVLAAPSLDLSVSEGSLCESNIAFVDPPKAPSSDAKASDSSIVSFPQIEPDGSRSLVDDASPLAHKDGFHQLYEALIPEEFRKPKMKRWYEILHAVLAFPIRLPILLTCPTVDPEKENCGWNKYLLVVTMLTFPSFAALAFDGFFQEISNEVILGPFLFGFGFILALAVCLFTKLDAPPSWNVAFAALSFIMSIVWIYIMADEVVNVVVTFAISLDITGALLGLLMIAAGNSICDLIANFFVAKAGQPMMGFAASYGSPLLNMLIGIGIASTAAIIKEGKPYQLQFPLLLKVGGGFLILCLLLALVLVVLRKWTAGKVLGGSLLTLYLVFFATVLSLELTHKAG